MEASSGGHRFPGVVALALFFLAGAGMAGLSALAILLPGTVLAAVWRLNPGAHASFVAMGRPGAVLLLAAVAAVCGAASWGLWSGSEWGRKLAVGVLAANLAGDAANALVRGEVGALVGLPIGGIMIAYLMSRRVRTRFVAGTPKGGAGSASPGEEPGP